MLKNKIEDIGIEFFMLVAGLAFLAYRVLVVGLNLVFGTNISGFIIAYFSRKSACSSPHATRRTAFRDCLNSPENW
ncbi:MAG: hypothetical protein R3B47_16800 [Bacteroidia bacterium]